MKKVLATGILGIIFFFLNINILWADIPDEPVLSVTPVFQNVSSNAGTASLQVSNTGTGTMAWTAEAISTSDWLTITVGASGSDAGTITCEYDDNAETAPRTAMIQITAADAANSPIHAMVAQAADGNATITSFDWINVLKVLSYHTSDMDAVLYFDVDNDGKISVKEAIYALQSSSQTREPSPSQIKESSPRAILSGPLAGANVSLYRLPDLELPVFQTQTDINGYFSTNMIGFSTEDVLLVKVSGGFDIGSGEPVLNFGAIHTLISGSDWIKGSFFVSAITDIAWQYTKNLVGDTDFAGIDRRLNELANTFFQLAIDGVSPVSKTDIFTLYPLDAAHRSALNFDYQILWDQNDDGLSIISCYHQNLSDAQALLLDSFFGDRLTRFPVADSQSDKVKLSVAVLGEGRVTSSDNAMVIDTGSPDPGSNVVSTFYDPADDTAVILTAVPTAETEILSWQGCDSISEDGTQCTAQMRSDHLVTLSFGYTETILDSTIQLVDLSEETVIVSQDGITLDVTLTSGNLSDLDSLSQGDVVVSSAGNGFLRRIVAIDKQAADHYILTTEDVALEEVVSQGTGTLYQEMTHGDLAEPAGTNQTINSMTAGQTVTGVETVDGVRLLPGESPDDRVFKFIVGDQPTDTITPMSEIGGDLTWTDPVSGVELTLSGTIDVTIDVETGVSFNWFKLQDFTFIPRINALESLEISVGGELETPKLEKTLASFKFQPITFFVGPVPVVVLPQVDLVIGIDAKIGAQVYTNISFTQMARAGIVYNRNAGLNVVKEFTLSYDFTQPIITGYAEALPYIKGSPSMMIYGVTGPGVFLRGYLKLKGEAEVPVFSDEVCSEGLFLSSYAGMDAGFAWDLGLLKKVLGDWSENVGLSIPLYQKEWLLRKWNVAGDCVQPPFLEVQGPDIAKTVQSGTTEIISEQYILKNTGELPLDWEIGYIQDSAISVFAHSGTLAENETTAVTVNIDTSKLSQGNYRNTLYFRNLYDAGLLAGYSSGTTTRQANVQVQASVNCGAYVAPDAWKQFDCYNLAAIGKTTNDDPFTPSWRLIGGYWQWGRKGPDSSQWYDTNTANFAHGPTGPDSGDTNEGVISSWNSSYAADGSWSDTSKTANDPCPVGYRVPTRSQWDGVISNNTQSIVGTWTYSVTNYSSARFFGNDLILPAAGRRDGDSGSLNYRGLVGYYWSRSQDTSGFGRAWNLFFDSDLANTYSFHRSHAFSVRCVAE